MKCYWWRGKPNFGDAIAKHLLLRWSGIEAEWSTAAESDIVIIGSILEHLPIDYRGIVMGCGLMYGREGYRVVPDADVRAVRGHLTKKQAIMHHRRSRRIVVGDPGLLADELVPLPEKEFNLGIVPHWTDKHLETRPEFLKYDPLIIDPTADPLTVIEQIGKCKKIISSSLHGVIVADAYGIPRRTELAPRFAEGKEGGVFKFRDYATSVGVPFEIGVTQEAPRWRVEDIQSELYDLFTELASEGCG